MKIRDWSQRILWFILGAVSIGVLISMSTVYGKRTEAGLPFVSVQELHQRVVSLEQRVKALEDRNAAEDKERKNYKPPREPREPRDPGDKPE